MFTCSHHATVYAGLEHPLALIPMVYFAHSPQTLKDNYVLLQKRWEKKQVPAENLAVTIHGFQNQTYGS